jgi:hypothetical protein
MPGGRDGMMLGNEKLYRTPETVWREMAAILDGHYRLNSIWVQDLPPERRAATMAA